MDVVVTGGGFCPIVILCNYTQNYKLLYFLVDSSVLKLKLYYQSNGNQTQIIDYRFKF
jgi:hypothetical protein